MNLIGQGFQNEQHYRQTDREREIDRQAGRQTEPYETERISMPHSQMVITSNKQ